MDPIGQATVRSRPFIGKDLSLGIFTCFYELLLGPLLLAGGYRFH